MRLFSDVTLTAAPCWGPPPPRGSAGCTEPCCTGPSGRSLAVSGSRTICQGTAKKSRNKWDDSFIPLWFPQSTDGSVPPQHQTSPERRRPGICLAWWPERWRTVRTAGWGPTSGWSSFSFLFFGEKMKQINFILRKRLQRKAGIWCSPVFPGCSGVLRSAPPLKGRSEAASLFYVRGGGHLAAVHVHI